MTVQALTTTSEACVVNQSAGSRKRPVLVGVRLTRDEDDRFRRVATAKGITVQELMRACTDLLVNMDEGARQ